jgi:hypothetical protein
MAAFIFTCPATSMKMARSDLKPMRRVPRTALLKKDPPLATGRSLGRNAKVSRFAAGLKRETACGPREPFRNRAARHEARRPCPEAHEVS